MSLECCFHVVGTTAILKHLINAAGLFMWLSSM
jgi:hypothetical protein